MDGCIVRCGIISSCLSAAISEILKRFWSPESDSYIRCATASTGLQPIPLHSLPLFSLPIPLFGELGVTERAREGAVGWTGGQRECGAECRKGAGLDGSGSEEQTTSTRTKQLQQRLNTDSPAADRR